MSVALSLSMDREGFSLRAELAVPGGVTGLLGPNGSGKSTLLMAIAGVLRATGRVQVGGQVLQDGAVWLPPEQRGVGVVFQDLRLFPHRTVAENLRYGARGEVGALIERLGLGELGSRMPTELSGGERQRVALGRALAMRPRLLLLDEPFAALDAGARAALIPWVGEVVREAGVPALVVGHRLDELLTLTDRLAVMQAGRVLAVGAPDEVLGSEAVLGLAHGMGLENVVPFSEAAVEQGVLRARVGGQVVVLPPQAPEGVVARGMGQVRLRPEDVVLAVGRVGQTSARNRLTGQIRSLTDVAGRVVARVDVGPVGLSVELTRAAVVELGLVVGAEVSCVFKATALRW